jgi:CheY-like chemotaxis protein/tRNA A-37 threonylcarbamoyl transferase component Bud32
MAKASAPVNLTERAHQVGIITLDQLRECWDELGSRNAPAEEILRMLQRKSYLTPFQIDKLQKGDTTGYFYGGSKVLYKVASGGFARVYRGINVQTGDPSAIKVLRQRWTSDKASIEAFYQEGKVGMALRHPNIVRIDEVAGHESVHYISMEFVEGGNLRDFLYIRGGRLDRGEAIRLMLEALQGLAYAFDQGVTHRDLKLTNLLASSQGSLKLVDFGLATVHKDERRAEEAHGQRTVEYALLEKTTGVEKGDPRSDIFFLGAVFYQMVTGTAPIPEKKDRAARLLRTRIDNIRPVLEIYPGADRQLAHIIDRMMSLKASERYQTPHEVIDALRGAAAMAPAPATPRPAPVSARPTSKEQALAKSVLLVEADANLQATIREKLHAIGYRVILTADPNRALDRFRESPADCVIVDCETTGKAGLDAFIETENVAKNRKLAWSGVVMLTPEQSEWSGRVTQADNLVVLVKPVTMRQLREHVKRMVPTGVETA